MKKLKFWASFSVFVVGSAFLGLTWIDSSQWMTLAITCLSVFTGLHTATDIAAIVKNGGSK